MDARVAYLLKYLLPLISVITQTYSGHQISLNVSSNIVESVNSIVEEEIKIVHFNYSLTDAVTENSSLLLALCVSVEDSDIAIIYSWDSKQFNLREQPSGQFSFSVKGLFVGRTFTHVKFVFSVNYMQTPCKLQTVESTLYEPANHFNLTKIFQPDEQSLFSSEGHFETVVIRPERVINMAFNVGIVLLVTIVNLGVGCKTDLEVVKAVLRRPVAPVIGFCSQFIIMPLTSLLAVKMFQFEPSMALGFFALGCSPGGSASNAYTMLLEGDVSLSITMTFISTLAALGMTPLWLLTLGQIIYSGTSIKIPYQNIIYSLIGMLIPVCIGLLIKRKRPGWAKVLIKISKVVMVVFLVYVLTVGIYANLYIFRLMTLPVIGASAFLPYVGFIVGGLVAFACQMPRAHVLTVAIETGIQNMGIAIVVLLLSLHHPESDISIVAPITSAMFTPLPLWVAIAFVQGRKRWCRKRRGEESEEEDKEVIEALQKEEQKGKNSREKDGNDSQRNEDNKVSVEYEDSTVLSAQI